MNIAVIGLGSMGRRRTRLLKKHFPEHRVIGIEANTERALLCKKEYGVETYVNIREASNSMEVKCAFICTPPITHSSIITECLEKDIHIFTELNLVKTGYEKNIALAKERNRLLFLSSTALYRKEMKYIMDRVAHSERDLGYSYHVGQYLPDWHPWENIHDSFFSKKESNGCRELMAIEMPWILKAFGPVKDLHVYSNKLTSLKIGFHDYFNIQIKHESGHMGNLIIDVVSREAVRKLEVFGEDIYVEWQGRPDSLRVKNLDSARMEPVVLYSDIDKLEGYSSTIIENQYLDEIKTFFQVLEGKEKAIYDFKDDLYTLDIIDRIEGVRS